MDYATVILLRRSGNINHDKDDLRLFLKTKEVICIFQLTFYCSQAQFSTDVSMAIVSPLNAVFFPSLFILCCHPTLAFSLPSFHPAPDDRLLPSAPFGIHCFHYRFPYSCGTSAFRSSLQFFLRPFLAFGFAGAPEQQEQQLQEPRHHLWLDAEPLQAARKPPLQLQSKPYFCRFPSFKLLSNDTNKQAKLHHYCQKWVNNSGYLISGLVGLVQKTENTTPSERGFGKISGNVFKKALGK